MLSAFLTNIISFPGLGIGNFKLNPVAFRLPLPWVDGGHPIMWYGIIIALAMVVGFLVAMRKAKYEGINSDTVFDLAIYLIIFAMIGARLYYVIMKPWQFDSIGEIFAVWNGGLAIYGGVIAGAITIVVFSKIKKIKPAKMLDAVAPGVIIGQAIGRWGNFFNAEAHGGETTLPWRMGIISDGIGVMKYYHPTFLYECLWNLLGFILINLFYKKKKYDGQIVLFYIVWYGFGRFFIEGLRTDSLYLLESVLGQTIRVSQLVAAICVIGGIVLMLILGKKAKYARLENEAYNLVYTEKHEADAEETAFEIKNENNNENEDMKNGENN